MTILLRLLSVAAGLVAVAAFVWASYVLVVELGWSDEDCGMSGQGCDTLPGLFYFLVVGPPYVLSGWLWDLAERR